MKITTIIRNVEKKYISDILDLLKEHEFTTIEFSLSEEERGFDGIEIAMKNYRDDFVIGAGTVTNKHQIDKLVDLGVDFIFTPAYSEELVKYSIEKNLKIIPGVFSPSEIQNGLKYNITQFKLFPANELSFGFLKAINGPFPKVELFAVGGVNEDNVNVYLEHGYSGVAIGSNIVMQNATDKDLETIDGNIKRLKRKLVNLDGK